MILTAFLCGKQPPLRALEIACFCSEENGVANMQNVTGVFGCGSRPFYNKEEKQLAAEAMDKMQITQLARRCYRELSGGQQQRVLLARALCATQKMLLLDEPVSGLDPKVTAEMYRLIDELNHRDGITIIMISHDIAAAVKYASHILHIGNTVFFGTKAEYLQSPQGRLFAAEKGGDEQ